MNSTSPVVEDLSRLLANTYALYLKTQNYHWNVTGEQFFMLHKAFEEQYEELSEAVDVVAERIRALKHYAPATFGKFQELATIKFDDNVLGAHHMLQDLLHDHEMIANQLQEMITRADEEGDEATMDLMIERQTEHQKTAWMLRSSLK